MPRVATLTPEQRRERKREAQRAWRAKKKAQRKEQTIERMKDELKSVREMKKQYDEEMEAKWAELSGINISEIFPDRPRMTKAQRVIAHNLLNTPTPRRKPRPARFDVRNVIKQYKVAREVIGKDKIRTVDFDLRGIHEPGVEFFLSKLPEFVRMLLSRINLDDHWTVYFEYNDGMWKQRTLDSITQGYLRDQVNMEITNNLTWEEYSEEKSSGDSFFPVSIRRLTQLRFINEDEVGLRGRSNNFELSARDFRNKDQYNIYVSLMESGADDKTIRTYLKRTLKNKRTGKFWRWINLIPQVRLERFMIFNGLNKNTVRVIERDNCFIYACRMAGVEEGVINNMRMCIHKRSFGLIDIQRVADECGLRFEIKTDNKLLTFSPKGGGEKKTIRMYLLEGHYMIREKVRVSPYFIEHRSEILKDKSLSGWTMMDKLLINRKDGKYWKKDDREYSLMKVIEAMFRTNAFKPITNAEYAVFNSMVCYENVDVISSLEYDEGFCTRLKKNNHSGKRDSCVE